MSSITIQDIGYTATLVAMECSSCHVPFAIPSNLLRAALDDGRTFYCPNGHPLAYLETELHRERKRREKAEREHEWMKTSRDAARDQAEAAEYRRRAAKGQLTKVKKRIAAGVCPCCQRTFQDLGRHMAGQHPEYAAPAAEVTS